MDLEIVVQKEAEKPYAVSKVRFVRDFRNNIGNCLVAYSILISRQRRTFAHLFYGKPLARPWAICFRLNLSSASSKILKTLTRSLRLKNGQALWLA